MFCTASSHCMVVVFPSSGKSGIDQLPVVPDRNSSPNVCTAKLARANSSPSVYAIAVWSPSPNLFQFHRAPKTGHNRTRKKRFLCPATGWFTPNRLERGDNFLAAKSFSGDLVRLRPFRRFGCFSSQIWKPRGRPSTTRRTKPGRG